MRIISRITRKALACSIPSKVRQILAEEERAAERRRGDHRGDVANLEQPLGFQPGLLDLHADAADMRGYLLELAAAANDRKLASDLKSAAGAADRLTAGLARATIRTAEVYRP